MFISLFFILFYFGLFYFIFCLFFCFFFVLFYFHVKESAPERPKERREAGSERDKVVYILISFFLNNIARWTLTLLIVLEFFSLFCNDF